MPKGNPLGYLPQDIMFTMSGQEKMQLRDRMMQAQMLKGLRGMMQQQQPQEPTEFEQMQAQAQGMTNQTGGARSIQEQLADIRRRQGMGQQIASVKQRQELARLRKIAANNERRQMA